MEGKKSDTDSFNICADSGASYCATPDEIDFVSVTYKHLTRVAINGIAGGLEVASCVSVSWIFQDDKKEINEIIIEQVLHNIGLPIRIIFPQQVAKQTGHIVDGLHAEKDEACLVFVGFKFTTKYNSHGGLPIYNYVNGISKFKAYNMELHQDGGYKYNLTLLQRSILKWHRRLDHMNL